MRDTFYLRIAKWRGVQCSILYKFGWALYYKSKSKIMFDNSEFF